MSFSPNFSGNFGNPNPLTISNDDHETSGDSHSAKQFYIPLEEPIKSGGCQDRAEGDR